MNCADCAFSHVNQYDDETIGLICRRHPPQIFVVDGEVAHGWPDVSEEMWCGEWGAA